MFSSIHLLDSAGVIFHPELHVLTTSTTDVPSGTANVTVIISDSPVSSPVLDSYDVAVVLNQQSLDKFEHKVKPWPPR